MAGHSYLRNFRIVRPQFEKSQESAIDWLATAHSAAEVNSGFPTGKGEIRIDHFKKLIARFGCSPEKISFRGHELEDFCHTDWNRMSIFRLNESPMGLAMEMRQRVFDQLVSEKCHSLFQPDEPLAEDLIHVSCTGYLSPSPLQKFVVARGHAHRTRVVHAYHMGCYAALPATRLADAIILQQLAQQGNGFSNGVDVVHTELCTLHFNPLDHSPEQLVVQSLFADGFVKYRVSSESQDGARGLKVLSMNEIQVPGSEAAMTWMPVGWGMAMTLSRDVPTLIAGSLKEFIANLFDRASMSAGEVLPCLVYAVHPGGPKIIDQVQALLEIPEEKIQASKNILKRCGNMSSATLPHVWNEILEDKNLYPSGTMVVSLAFGPGLTIAGSLFEVVG